MKKTAVILFNLGGPDSLDAVKPFLFNLFYDPAIISIPNPIRFLLAKLISGKREDTAKEIYSYIGGKSPIMEETIVQKDKLEVKLNSAGDGGYKVFISMRYWNPFSEQTIKDVEEYAPDEIILLPLYPQFSTTTTESSFKDWNQKAESLNIPTRKICCYPLQEDFIKAHVDLLSQHYVKATGKKRILFSAHGLPEKIIAKGDPYQKQIEKTAHAIMEKWDQDADWIVCYQSRVGPLKWIGPSTENEIKRAGEGGMSLVIVPVAFVSEHSETLVELDIEYKELADESGVNDYVRVPTLSANDGYIDSLVDLCLRQSCKRVCEDGLICGF